MYKLDRSWLEKTADDKAVYQLDKAWLQIRKLFIRLIRHGWTNMVPEKSNIGMNDII